MYKFQNPYRTLTGQYNMLLSARGYHTLSNFETTTKRKEEEQQLHILTDITCYAHHLGK